jgi:Domain of unknown function (DUF3806)
MSGHDRWTEEVETMVVPNYVHYTWFALGACLFVGCTPASPPGPQVPNQPNQKLSALTEGDQQRLRDRRAVVEAQLGNEDAKQKYQTAAGKLGTLRAILQAGVFKRGQTHELQCLGVVLGDAFVQELGMEWIIVEDEYGRDPAVRMPGTSIILYPLTMISKRIERGEQVDVFELFNGVAGQVEELKRQAR